MYSCRKSDNGGLRPERHRIGITEKACPSAETHAHPAYPDALGINPAGKVPAGLAAAWPSRSKRL
jgi:hypothetical protein